ncbi:MAG: hypothetical protein ABSC94_24115 [Polyangiaceae bacterium]
MRYARHIGLGLVGLCVLAFGALAIIRVLEPSSPATPASTVPHTTISIAKLSRENAPDNCADVTFLGKKEVDRKKLEARGFTILESSCSRAFPNSIPLATCSRSDVDGDAQPSTEAVGYYYDVATIEGDETYRGQCLGAGGAWMVKPQNDPQLASARTRLAGAKPHHEFDSLMELAP